MASDRRTPRSCPTRCARRSSAPSRRPSARPAQPRRAQGAVDDLAETVETCARAPSSGSPAAARPWPRRSTRAGRPPTRTCASSRPSCARIGRRLDAIEERLPARRKPAEAASRPSAAPGQAQAAASAGLMPGRRVLITGVGSHLGAELAAPARARPERRATWPGLDTRAAEVALERTEFIEADIRNPVIAQADPARSRSTRSCTTRSCASRAPGCRPQAMHDINVIGSLQLLAALREGADDPRRSWSAAPPASTAPSRTRRSSSPRR